MIWAPLMPCGIFLTLIYSKSWAIILWWHFNFRYLLSYTEFYVWVINSVLLKLFLIILWFLRYFWYMMHLILSINFNDRVTWFYYLIILFIFSIIRSLFIYFSIIRSKIIFILHIAICSSSTILIIYIL